MARCSHDRAKKKTSEITWQRHRRIKSSPRDQIVIGEDLNSRAEKSFTPNHRLFVAFELLFSVRNRVESVTDLD